MPNKFNWDKSDVWKDYRKRYEIIKKAIQLKKDLPGWDDRDLVYFTKMLFENRKVYCSEGAWTLIQADKDSCHFKKGQLKKLEKGEEQDDYLQYKVQKCKRNTNTGESFIWEHVVPINQLVSYFNENTSIDEYKQLLELGVICIVTVSEDNKLTKKGLRMKMPNAWKWHPGTTITNECIWARYIEAGIEVVGVKETWKKLNGRIDDILSP